jgi:hypothetical protein
MPAPMVPLGVRARSLAFQLPKKEASFERHGFPGLASPSRRHLEYVIETFITGFNLAVETPVPSELTTRLEASCPSPYLGFAYEGVGLWLSIADLMLPWTPSRLASFTKDVAPRFDFIAMVGAGFALARLPFGKRRIESYQERLDPFTAWCLADGYGFHQGFFHWQKFVSGREPSPASLNPQNRALFDAGIGRSFWWVHGANPEAIARAIGVFAPERRPEMWTGIGTALAYAGGGPAGDAEQLLALAGEHAVDLRIGVALGANMRQRGGNPAAWTDAACQSVLNAPMVDASDVVDAEVKAYLASWDGQERSMREGCYLALRARLDARYQDHPGRAS